MSAKVAMFRRRNVVQAPGDEQIAACEEQLLRAHDDALAQICTALDQHIELHGRMLNLLTESDRKSAAFAQLRMVGLASRFMRDKFVAAD